MKTTNMEMYHRTRLPVKFIQAEPVHPVYAGRNFNPASQLFDGLLHGFAGSGDAAEIDRGIRDTIMGIRASILLMGLGLAKIKADGLYTDLNCRSMFEYMGRLSDDTKMYRGSIYNWLYIGEAYIKYRNELEQVGFTDSDGPSKLPYLDIALESKQRQEVFSNIKSMSVREFVSFAKAKNESAISAAGDRPVVTKRGNAIYIDGRLAIIMSKKMENGISSHFREILDIACDALEAGEVIHAVRLRNRREAKVFAAASERLITKIRSITSARRT